MAPKATKTGRLRPGAKFDDATFVRLAYFFCNGVPVSMAARWTGLSGKTVRALYLDLRARLLVPQFNRWHGTNRRLINLPESADEVLVRAGYFHTLAVCALNAFCARNWRLGNRKKRQCRSCPLANLYSDATRAEAYAVIDTVHAFYEAIGIRSEKAREPVMLFRERLIHTTTVATVQSSSRKLANGLFDPFEKTFLSGGTLLDLITGQTG